MAYLELPMFLATLPPQLNFGLIYGMRAKGFVNYIFREYDLIISLMESKEFRKKFFGAYVGLIPWHERQTALVQRQGYVETLTGRIRRLPGISSDDWMIRSHATLQAINSPVQGFAGELILMAVTEIHKTIPQKYLQLCGTVHDSIIGRVKKKELKAILPEVRSIMENPKLMNTFGLKLPIPLITEIKTGPWGIGKVFED